MFFLVFSSTVFLFAFLPITLAGYYFLPRRFRNGFVTLASLLFYAWGEPKFVLIMCLSIFMNYLFGLLVVRREDDAYRRGILTMMVISNLSLFFVFKYLNFTIENLNVLLGGILPQTHIRLPIGISFFTFQAMSYVFDVSLGRGEVQKNPLNVALYISLFPQLIAGPIVRYETVAEEIQNRQESLEDFVRGIRRFTVGLAKKVLLSNSIGLLADQAFGFGEASQLSVAMAWLGVLAYAFQIYFYFGGYSDMAIGLGLMFGFHFDENFCYPYISRTVAEFWQRWHISLGSWFRDYLFYPVSRKMGPLSKRVKQRWGKQAGRLAPSVVGLAVVWLCTGIWHGASWGYILWGVYYGVLLISALIFQPVFKKLVKTIAERPEDERFAILQFAQSEIEKAAKPMETFFNLPYKIQDGLTKLLCKIDDVNESFLFKDDYARMSTIDSLYDTFRVALYGHEDMADIDKIFRGSYKKENLEILKSDYNYYKKQDVFKNDLAKEKVLSVVQSITDYFEKNI